MKNYTWYIFAAIAALGAVFGINEYRKYKKQKAELDSLNNTDTETPTEEPKSGGIVGNIKKSYKISYITLDRPNLAILHFVSNPKADNSLAIGKKIILTSTGELNGTHTISNRMIDANGNITALFIPFAESKKTVSLDANDKRFENKGTITIF